MELQTKPKILFQYLSEHARQLNLKPTIIQSKGLETGNLKRLMEHLISLEREPDSIEQLQLMKSSLEKYKLPVTLSVKRIKSGDLGLEQTEEEETKEEVEEEETIEEQKEEEEEETTPKKKKKKEHTKKSDDEEEEKEEEENNEEEQEETKKEEKEDKKKKDKKKRKRKQK
ncbi:hypothetical protein ABK040_008940 [Willaertia magna]